MRRGIPSPAHFLYGQPIAVRMLREAVVNCVACAVVSVAGAEFSVASVASGVGQAIAAVETVCEQLAQREQFIAERELVRWPDGTVSGQYGFRHALYQEVLYQRIGAGRRARLHLEIGAHKEKGYGARASEVAAELAMHFERGHNYERAVHYLYQASQHASRRSAVHETIVHLTKGLELLALLPESPDRLQQELLFHSTLGLPLILTAGYTAPAVEHAYNRARELCQRLGEAPHLFPALFRLWTLAVTRADMRTARDVAERLLAVAQPAPDPEPLALAYYAMGVTLYYCGEWGTASEHLERGLVTYDAQQDRAFTLFYSEDRGVTSHCHLAVLLWGQGYPEQALRRLQTALDLAQELARSLSLTRAWSYAAALHYFRREWPQMRTATEAMVVLATEHGFPFRTVVGVLYRGAGLVAEGQAEEGVAQLRQGLAKYRSWGTEITLPYFLAMLADAEKTSGQAEEGLAVVTEALVVMEKTGERLWEAELYRLRGELTLQSSVQRLECQEESQKAKIKRQKSGNSSQ